MQYLSVTTNGTFSFNNLFKMLKYKPCLSTLNANRFNKCVFGGCKKDS